jgi:hypothetical protein
LKGENFKEKKEVNKRKQVNRGKGQRPSSNLLKKIKTSAGKCSLMAVESIEKDTGAL